LGTGRQSVMRYLILSDIHSNLEALEAVMQKAQGEYERAICCGDIVGYGPSPNEVTESIRALAPLVVRGNHEKAALGMVDLSLFNPLAKQAALWTRDVLTPENRDYLRMIPSGPIYDSGFTVVHGSVLDEDEYLIDREEALLNLRIALNSITFFGHTHIQGGFVVLQDGRSGVLNPVIRQGANEGELRIDPQHKYLINPGSVGQPRDYDPRAGFVIYDEAERLVRYFRAEYPIQMTQDKMLKAHLPQYLIDRLRLGR
jgi:predicted phosphodiesterase